jgi:hypothetical protein
LSPGVAKIAGELLSNRETISSCNSIPIIVPNRNMIAILCFKSSIFSLQRFPSTPKSIACLNFFGA